MNYCDDISFFLYCRVVIVFQLGSDHLTCKGGGMVFFRTTRELEYLFCLPRQARILFPEYNIRLYDKNSESDFFFSPPKSEYFFQQHWESEYFFRKKP